MFHYLYYYTFVTIFKYSVTINKHFVTINKQYIKIHFVAINKHSKIVKNTCLITNIIKHYTLLLS